jgi:cobalt-zinc-cadmium resistance protein CzcA
MLSKIISFSVRNKLIIGLLTIGFVIYGVFQLSKLSIDAVPDITNNQVQVITVAPSMGTTDIERLITFPLEQSFSNIPELKEIRSFSRFGLSLVTLVFEDKTNVYWARQQVSERLQTVRDQIPDGVESPFLAPVTTGLGEIFQYIIKAKPGYERKYSLSDLRTIQDWIVRRELIRVEGVADVSSFGGYLKQYEVAIKPEVLNAYGLSIQDVYDAMASNNQNTGGSYIEKQSSAIFIRTEGMLSSIDQILAIPVKYTDAGVPISIRQVAEVREGHALRFGAMTYNGESEVAGAVVMMIKGGNSSNVIKAVKKKVADIEKMLPEGVEIVPFLDRTKMVNNSISTVEQNLLEGALIVMFILVLFLGNLRAGLLVASVIPLSMLFAVSMMNLFGVSGNLMSLGALDFGLIVDGAVIIVEAVLHQLSHSKHFRKVAYIDGKEMDNIVQTTASKMVNAAVFGQIIILLVYLPIFSLSGIEGKMFKPMAQTVIFALLGAFILSLTYIPMMSALIMDKKGSIHKSFSDKVMEKVERWYQGILTRSLRRPYIILSIIAVMFVSSIVLLSRMGGEFIPTLEEGDFAIETWVKTGSNLNISTEACLKAEKILLENFPEVKMVVGKTGSSEIPVDPMPLEASDLMVILKDKSEWTSAKTFDELAEKMSAALEAIPGVRFGFQYPVQMRFNELLSGAKQDVVCKIYGEDLDTLSKYADLLASVINEIEGTADIFVESVEGLPQVVVQYKRPEMAQYGLSISEVNNTVQAAFAGKPSGWVYEGEKRFGLIIKMDEEKRNDIREIEQLLIPTSRGNAIPLSLIASVELKSGPNQVQREDGKRRIVVGFNTRGRDVQSIVNELESSVSKQIVLPAGYRIHYGGAFENLNAAKKRLSIVVPIALGMIFIMLYFAFSSVKLGLLIYTAIPLSAIGGIVALYLRDLPFSISAGIGFIALFGVAVLNGIVLMTEFNQLKLQGLKDARRIVLMGTKVRLRPVLMTASVASLGFFPMAISHGAGAEVQRPLATVVIGGLLMATLLTLIVLPVLYVLFDRVTIRPSKTFVAMFSFLMLFQMQISAQNKVSLDEAINTALSNNLNLTSEQLAAEYREKMIRSSKAIAPAEVAFGFGQINSIYLDNSFQLSQQLPLPMVFHSRKELYHQEWLQSLAQVKLKEQSLKREVASVYENITFLTSKKKLLDSMQLLYREQLERASNKLKAGETNALEVSLAEAQLLQVNMLTGQIQTEMEMALLQLQMLMNTREQQVPSWENYGVLFDHVALFESTGHPLLEMLRAEEQVAKAQTSLLKAARYPEVILRYNNQTLKGTGADNLVYDNKRFQSFQLGLGIPLSFGSSKAEIHAAKIRESIAGNNVSAGAQQLDVKFQSLLALYQQLQSQESSARSYLLSAAEKIRATVDAQFSAGEIDFIQWSYLMQQSMTMQANYLDILHQLNQTAIQIQFFTIN